MNYLVSNPKEAKMGPKELEKRRKGHREYIRKKYHNDPAYRKKHLQLIRQGKKRLKKQVRELLAKFKGCGCAICPEREMCCLSAHHRDPRKKSFNIGMTIGQFSVPRVIEELKKCVCLCENCHRKVHAGILKAPV